MDVGDESVMFFSELDHTGAESLSSGGGGAEEIDDGDGHQLLKIKHGALQW